MVYGKCLFHVSLKNDYTLFYLLLNIKVPAAVTRYSQSSDPCNWRNSRFSLITDLSQDVAPGVHSVYFLSPQGISSILCDWLKNYRSKHKRDTIIHTKGMVCGCEAPGRKTDVNKGWKSQCQWGSKFLHIQTIVGLVLLFRIRHRPNRECACCHFLVLSSSFILFDMSWAVADWGKRLKL